MRALALPAYYGHHGRPTRPTRPSRPYRTPRPHPVSIIPIHDDPETNYVTGGAPDGGGDVPSFGPTFDSTPFVVLRPLRPGTGYVSGAGGQSPPQHPHPLPPLDNYQPDNYPPIRPLRPSRPLAPSRPDFRPDPDLDSNHIDRPQRPQRPSTSSDDASKSARDRDRRRHPITLHARTREIACPSGGGSLEQRTDTTPGPAPLSAQSAALPTSPSSFRHTATCSFQ